MKYSNYIGIAAALLIIAVANMPWIYIPSIQTSITGFGSPTQKLFGKPVLMHIYLLFLLIPFFLIPKIWAKKINPFLGAITAAWALRNFFLLSTCRNGECPQTQTALYVYLLLAVVVLVMTVLPEMKIKKF